MDLIIISSVIRRQYFYCRCKQFRIVWYVYYEYGMNRDVWWDSYGKYRSSLLACTWRYWGKLGRFSLRLRLLIFGKDRNKEYSILFGVYDFICLNWSLIFAYWYNIKKVVPKGMRMFTLCYNKCTCTKEIRSSATAEGASYFNKSSYILACTPALYMLDHAVATIPASAFRNHVRRASWTPTSFA